MRVACIMMQRDEDLLLDGWCRYHGALFGYENLFIFDNGSKKASVRADLDRYRRLGCWIGTDHDQTVHFAQKGEVLGALMRSLRDAAAYDFMIPMDCDEFLAVMDGPGVTFQKKDIERELGRFVGCMDTIKICDEFPNSPSHPDYFYRLDSNKTAFAANAFEKTDHGYHKAGTATGTFAASNVAHIHFHNKPFARTLSDAQQKLAGLGVDVSDPEEIAAIDHSMHLKRYFGMNEAGFLASFDSKCHIEIAGFTQRMIDLGVHSSLLVPPMANRKPTLLFPGEFDCGRYLDANPDVRSAGAEGIKHYMLFGASEGRALG